MEKYLRALLRVQYTHVNKEFKFKERLIEQ